MLEQIKNSILEGRKTHTIMHNFGRVWFEISLKNDSVKMSLICLPGGIYSPRL